MGADLEPVQIAAIHMRSVVDCLYLLQVVRRLGSEGCARKLVLRLLRDRAVTAVGSQLAGM